MAGVAALLAGLALLAVPALLVPATLGVRGPLARLVAGLIAAAATIVLATEVLSLLSAWRPGWMLLAQLIAALAAAGAWRLAGAPPVRLALPGRTELEAAARAHPVAAAAIGLAVVALLFQAAVAVSVAPNNSDSMTYHLARVAYWLQADSALHFDGGTVRQLGNPPNAEFLQGWTILLAETDRFAQLVQWLAVVGLGAAVALGARLLGFDRPASAFAGALFVLLPQPLLQASSTQNDAITTFLLIAALALIVRGIRDRHLGEAGVGLVAIALAVGTKGTALIAGFSAVLLVGAALLAYRPPVGLLLRGAAIGVAALALFGLFNYVLNVDTFGDPIGPLTGSTGRDGSLPGAAALGGGLAAALVAAALLAYYRPAPDLILRGAAIGAAALLLLALYEQTVRIAWSFADSPGLEVAWLSNVSERVGEALFSGVKDARFQTFAFDTRVQEDFSSYGLFGLFVFLPLLLVVLFRRSTPLALRLTAAAALLYLLAFAVSSEENPWIGRVLMPAMALGAPLLALLYRRRWLAIASLVLVAIAVVPVLTINQSKPLLPGPGEANVLALDRLEQQTMNRPTLRPPVRALEAELGPDAPIGLVRGGNSWDYLFFGPDLDRRVEPLDIAEATPETIGELGLAGIVFANVEPPAGLDVEQIGQGYWLLR